MRKITCVAVKYDDDTVEVFHGKGEVHETKTHNSPSRDLPRPADPVIHLMQLHIGVDSKESGYHTVIVQ